MNIDLLSYLRAIGLLIASGIGIFRLVKNHMTEVEQINYILMTFSCLWFALVYLATLFGPLNEQATHTLRNQLLRAGWMPLIASQILTLLYYRRYPRR